LGFGVQCLGSRVHGTRYRVQGVWVRFWGFGWGAEGLSLGFGVEDLSLVVEVHLGEDAGEVEEGAVDSNTDHP